MPRRERPLEPGEGPLPEFAAGLRQLRRKAGNAPYRTLAERVHYSISTLSSAAAGQRLPTLAVTLAYVRACDGDAEEWERRWREAAEQLGEGDAVLGEADESGTAPYAGLRPFREQDAEWFFGRERLVEELAERLERQRLVVVIGASGSGKSSLMRAGLVPRLRVDAATAVVLTPGPRPLEECAVRLGALVGIAPGGLYGELKDDPENLSRVLRQVAARCGVTDGPAHGDGDGDRDVVLVVDQFEEIFTLCRDEAERDCFIKSLIAAASSTGGGCRVALGLRADFYAHCTRNALLVEALRDAQVPVGPMRPDELRRAVTRPAQRAGLSVEGALLATLTAQAQGQAGVLPLLSHALLQTWRRRRGNALTLAGFEAAGGLEGALARTAEEFYQQLDAEQRTLVRQVFVRLTALGEGTEDTRRPARLDELDGLAGADDTGIRTVLERAAGARLLILDHERVELAHEALIRCWPRLHGWLTEDREAMRTLHQLSDAAQVWETLGRDPGALFRGTRLAMAAGLARTSMSVKEQEFLDAGLASRAAEQRAVRRRTRFRQQAVVLLGVLLALASVTAGLAVRAQWAADRQRDVAGSQRTADKAAALRAANPALAAQLSLAAYRLSPTPEARGTLLSTFATPYATQLTAQKGAVTAVAFSPDGRVLATGDADRTVALWRAEDPYRPTELSVLPRLADAVHAVAISPDSRLLAEGGEGGAIVLWDIGDARRPRLLARLPGDGGPVIGLAFGPGGRTLATAAPDGIRLWQLTDPQLPRVRAESAVRSDVTAMALSRDGRTLATGHADHRVRLWDVEGPLRELSAAPGHKDAVTALAFTPDGRELATGSADFTVRLWDATDPRHVRTTMALTGHTDAVKAVGFSPDGRTLATSGVDGTVRRWEVTGPGPAPELPVLTGHTGSVGALAFSPDGRTLATGSEDQTTRLWDLPGPALTGHTSSVYSVNFSPDGRLLATGSYDRTVRLWSLADLRRPHALPPLSGHTGPVNSVVFRPDGRVLASGSADSTFRLWDLEPPSRPRQLAVVPSRTGHVNSVAFSPDGGTLATGSEQGAVQLWDASDVDRPRLLAEVRESGAVDSVAFAPGGRTLAVASRNRTAVLWDLTDPRNPTRLAVLSGHTSAVKSVAFSPDGRTLATGGEDRTVRLWDITDPRRPALRDRLSGYADGVMAVAFAPNGRMLAAASSDRTARLYDVNDHGNALEPALLSGHTKPVDTLAFSPDGRTLATGGEDWTVLLWDPDPGRVASRICDSAFPALTHAEWGQYFPQWKYRSPC